MNQQSFASNWNKSAEGRRGRVGVWIFAVLICTSCGSLQPRRTNHCDGCVCNTINAPPTVPHTSSFYCSSGIVWDEKAQQRWRELGERAHRD